MTAFRGLLLLSWILAALAIALEFAVLGAPFPSFDFDVRPFLQVLVIGCLVVFVVGLLRFRLTGLWLAVPLAAMFAQPIWFGVTLANAIAECQKHHDWHQCVP